MNHLDAALQSAADKRFTGTIYSETFEDPRMGTCRQVFEYRNGYCTDAYVTKAGTQL